MLTRLSKTISVSLVLLVFGFSCVATTEETSPWHRWSTLQMKAHSVPLFKGRVEMRLTEEPGEHRLETTTSARFLGVTVARSTTTSTFEPTTGTTKEYRSLSKKRGRHFAFGAESYTVARLRPTEAQDAADPWEIAYQHEYPNPPADESGSAPRLFDYYGMLLHLRHAGLEAPGDETTLYVATSAGPNPTGSAWRTRGPRTAPSRIWQRAARRHSASTSCA